MDLDATTLDRLSPCRITVDHRGLVSRIGPSIQRLLGSASLQQPFTDFFELIEPAGIKLEAARHLQNVQISVKSNSQLQFGGCIVHDTDASSPGSVELLMGALARAAVSADTPLRYKDFAPTDNAIEMLMAMQARAALAHDAQRLAGELTEARANELATEAKERFIANMSHELRTPLNSIIGYTEIVCEDFASGDTSNTLADLGYVSIAARHLLTIIGNMLDFAKINAGRMQVELLPVDFAKQVRDAVAIMAPAATRAGNRIELVADDCLLGKSDPTKLQQCLLNLLSNAVKFTANGTITVSLKVVEAQDSEFVEIAIEDEGEGMDEATLKKLFMPFVQESATTARKHGGTGLGLAITRQLSTLLGGDISVTSKVGVGSCFTMRIARGEYAQGIEQSPQQGSKQEAA